MIGQSVFYDWEGCYGVYPPQQLPAVVIDQRQNRRGQREWLLKVETLNTPRWVNADTLKKETTAGDTAVA